jgi:lipid-A-disaccharide synthase
VRPNLALLSGEISGDVVGAALAKELLRLRPDLELWGMGSRHMAEAGVELLYNSGEWSAISIVETLKLYPKLRWSAYPHVVQEIRSRKPAAVILIDFGAFNVKVAYKSKEAGVPVLYYFPPGSWKRKGRVRAEVAQVSDLIATQFPWSEERLRSVGANVQFVGHPLLEIVRPSLTRAQFAERFGMDPGKPIIGLLPGSRGFEVEYNTPAMLGAARIIHKQLPGAQFVFGVASEMARARIEQALDKQVEELTRDLEQRQEAAGHAADVSTDAHGARLKAVTPEGVTINADDHEFRTVARRRALQEAGRFALPPTVLVEGLGYDVMAHSDALIVCSGTATLEAAILGTPMTILYRGSKLMELEGKILRRRPEHFGLPNIIADARIVPELLQHEASPEALAEHTLRYVSDPALKGQVKAKLQAVRDTLGAPGASERTARLALDLAGLTPQDD